MSDLALPAISAPFVHPRDGRNFAKAATDVRRDVDAKLGEAIAGNGDVALAVLRTNPETFVPRLQELFTRNGRETANFVLPFVGFVLLYPLVHIFLGINIFAPHKPEWTLYSIAIGLVAATSVVSTLFAALGIAAYFWNEDKGFDWDTYEGSEWALIVRRTASAIVVGERRVYLGLPAKGAEKAVVREIHFDALGKVDLREGRLTIHDRSGVVLADMTGATPVALEGACASSASLVEIADGLRSRIPA